VPEHPAKTSDRLVGEILHDTYKITGVLGRGGMGTVHEAINVRLGKRVAVKVLRPAALDEPGLIHRFRREAKIATDLGHPHIIDILDFNEMEDGSPYMVMELLQGRDLESLIRQHRTLPVERMAFIIRQVCSALHAVHQHSVVHRDLKPENIFLCSNKAFADFVVVLDFGISKILGSTSVQTQGAFIGTPHYMAPEQAELATDQIGPAADIFALGSIMYRTLTGDVPFASDTLPALLYQVVHSNPRPMRSLRPDVPEAVEAIVSRAMKKAPTDRFPSVRALSIALLEAVPAAAAPLTDRSWEEEAGSEQAAPVDALGDTVGTPSPLRGDSQASVPTEQSTLSSAAAELSPASPVAAEKERRPWGLAAAGALLILGVGALAFWASRDGESSQKGTLVATAAFHDADRALPSPDAAPLPDTRNAPDSSPDSAAPRVSIAFRGKPKGARVINARTGKLLGEVPFQLATPGSETPLVVRIVHRGFVPARRRVVLDRHRTIRVSLKRRPPSESDLPPPPPVGED
jgi:serine/threonine-protein kinase